MFFSRRFVVSITVLLGAVNGSLAVIVAFNRTCVENVAQKWAIVASVDFLPCVVRVEDVAEQ